MGLSLIPRRLLFFLGTFGICSGFVQENCTNYELQFERVYSIPGDVAMLNSTLVSPDVFNFTTVPYNITWYDSKTGHEINNQTGRILVQEMTLWFLQTTLDDNGEYVTILRTPSRCFMQTTKLIVDLPVDGECGRPRKVYQALTKGFTDKVSCPLEDQIKKLMSYNITPSLKWYKGCEPIEDETDRYTYWDKTKLRIDQVHSEDNGLYTCTLTFTLGGLRGSMSETINAWVKAEYTLTPQVHEPANEIIKTEIGSNFTKRCLVFVPCVGIPIVDIMWLVEDDFIFSTDPTDRIYISETRVWSQDEPVKGLWFEKLLMFLELKAKDFNVSYTCRAYSNRGHHEGYFILQPADPDILLPIGLMLCGVTVIFVSSVIIYYIFKVDIVLWFRRAFPVFYPNKDLDGKLYDAYVAYPQPCAVGYKEVEEFALHTLPQVLEKACGYKLFIVGRDCLPGEAMVDSVEENLQASRSVLLLYTASTFTSKRHTSSMSSNNNNTISQISDTGENLKNKTMHDKSSINYDSEKEVYSDTRQQFECVAAMHRALLEGSLKVVLVELEEISPAQLAFFPESLRQLRKRQGTVCWWKTTKRRQMSGTCMRRTEDKDEEKGGRDTKMAPSPSPSSRFWKEMRYHMPVRGKREIFPEKTALLKL
ncbi:interleukin-1 receptor type 1-like isoform X2 [Cheilinus undulatus]|nr:interleukin-1 receptor type 1-like isoform X2 [Cheilinus undulatus]XP_041662993.1 interleukin-1 receptor type 1-like isoform X2 [Cheilinus undulatus]XP_041662995.1 interleukin-1 receptor type 1-like isoform X2 [Cheilinus undulatus]